MEIRTTLEELDYSVSSLGSVELAQSASPPRTDAEVLDRGFTQTFLDANSEIGDAVSQCDIAIINGEGTLHGTGQATFTLLFLARLAKVVFGKPTFAINMSLFPNDGGESEDASDTFYKNMLSPLDRMAVREPLSLAVSKRLGLKCVQSFDCLPRYLNRLSYKKTKSINGPILLGGGLGVDPLRFADLANVISNQVKTRQIRYVVGAKAHPALDDQRVIDQLRATAPAVTVAHAHTFENWADLISGASCLISGRFHHTIAAYFLGTPAIVFEAGTPKIQGLCAALKQDPPLSMRDSSLINRVVEAVESALSENANMLDAKANQLMLDRGAINFHGL